MILDPLSTSCRRCRCTVKAHWNFCENCGNQIRKISSRDADSDISSEVIHIAQIDKVSKHYASTQKNNKKISPVEMPFLTRKAPKKIAPEQVKLMALEYKNAQMVLEYEGHQQRQQLRQKIAGYKDKAVVSTSFPKLKSVGYLDALPSVLDIEAANKEAVRLQQHHPSPAARRKEEVNDLSMYKKEDGWYWGAAAEVPKMKLPQVTDGVFWGQQNDYYNENESDTDEEAIEKSVNLDSFDVGDMVQAAEVEEVSLPDTDEDQLLHHLHIGKQYTKSIKDLSCVLRSTVIDYRSDPVLCVGSSNPLPYYKNQLTLLNASLHRAEATAADISTMISSFGLYCDKRRQRCALAIALAQENCEAVYETFNIKYEQLPQQIKKDKSGQPDPYLLKTAQAKFQAKVDAKMTELGDKLHRLVAEEAKVVAELKNAEAKVEKCLELYYDKHNVLMEECRENLRRITFILHLTAARKIKRLLRLYIRHKHSAHQSHLEDDFYEVVVSALAATHE